MTLYDMAIYLSQIVALSSPSVIHRLIQHRLKTLVDLSG